MVLRSKISFFAILLLIFLDVMGMGLVYPMFSSLLFQVQEGPSLISLESAEWVRGFWLGFLLAMMPLAQFFSAPILGTFSDQRGRKPILILTLCLSVFGYGISVFAVIYRNLFLLILGRIFVGIAAGNFAVACAVLADISPAGKKVKNFGLLNMVAGFGFTVGPFLGGKLSEKFFFWEGGFEKPFLFAGVLALFNLLLMAFFQETFLPKKTGKLNISLGIKNFKKVSHHKGFPRLLLCIFIFCFGWSFYWEFIPVTWIKEYGLTPSEVGNFYAYAAGFYALSSGFLIGPISRIFSGTKILFGCLILSGISILIFTFHGKILDFWMYIPIQQIGIAFLFPTAAAMVSDFGTSEDQGETLGIYQSVESLAFVLSPLFSGVLVSMSHQMPIFVGGFSMLLAALVLGWRRQKIFSS